MIIYLLCDINFIDALEVILSEAFLSKKFISKRSIFLKDTDQKGSSFTEV